MSSHAVGKSMPIVDMEANPKLKAALGRWWAVNMPHLKWKRPVYLGLAFGVSPCLFVTDSEGGQQRVRFDEMRLP